MKTDINMIFFTLEYKGETHSVMTKKNEFYSLMVLISDRLAIPDFGICCGMGSCGTCMIELAADQPKTKTRLLSCGIAINDRLASTRVLITDQSFNSQKR